ncbi:hypothetical protein VCRA219O19_70103 [Vibrio crassostreae]|nr:hypothetical protein VCRA219O19_70103 [Vibrio crassostreae]CAK3756080.1 hypothetical protein VCRA217O17_190028 [Vibrio crassostreae]
MGFFWIPRNIYLQLLLIAPVYPLNTLSVVYVIDAIYGV